MLHLLSEFAEQHDLAAAPGFKKDFVRWLLRFSSTGEYLGAVRRGDDRSKGDLFRLPRLPESALTGNREGRRHFLCDQLKYVLCLEPDNAPDLKLSAQHEYFVGMLRQAASDMPILGVVADALSHPGTREQIQADLLDRRPPAKLTDWVTFAVNGHEPPVLVESPDWHDWYARFLAGISRNKSTRGMLSLASGQLVTPAKTHPKISGLGGQGAGDAFASFKQSAFRHFGLEQAENAAVSDAEAAVYRAALDALIRSHSRSLAGAKIAYWYAGPGATTLAPEEDPIQAYVLPMAEVDDAEMGEADANDAQPLTPEEQAELTRQAEAQAADTVRKLLDAVRAGERPDLIQTKFYALSLAANSGRVVVRDWMQGEFPDLAASVLRWVGDLSVSRLDSPQVPEHVPKLNSLVTCVLSVRKLGQKYNDWVKPVGKLREPLWRAAVGMRSQESAPPPIPNEAIGMMLPHWRASVLNGEFDSAVAGKATSQFKDWKGARGRLYARVSLLKAYLIRTGVIMEPHLFEDHPEPAYHCGRLLAVLADIQRAALGDVGANVVQRYYARASTAPADAIGPLVRLSNAHLDKIADRGLTDYLQGKVASIFGKLGVEQPPRALDTVGQGLFAMGFYQQIARMRHERAENIARKRDRQQGNDADSTPSNSGE